MIPHNSIKSKILSLIPVLLLFSCLLPTSLAAGTLQIDISTAVINTSPVIYTFTFSTADGGFTTIGMNSLIYIDFPTDYTQMPASPSCLAMNGTSLTCDTSSNRITVRNFFYVDFRDSSFQFRISNVINPGHAGSTASFSGSIVNITSTGPTVLDGSTTVSLTEASATCGLTTGSYIIGGLTNITFTVTAKTQIPTGGSLEITFPWSSWWNRTAEDSLIVTKTTCSVTTTTASGTATCNNQTYSGSGGGSQLIVTSLPSAVSANTALTFVFSTIRNPPVGSGVTVTLRTRDALSRGLDTCTMTLKPTVTNNITVSSSTLMDCTQNAGSKLINSFDTCVFRFTTTNPLQNGSTINVRFPAEVGVSSPLQVNEDSPNSITGLTIASSPAFPDVTLNNPVGRDLGASTQFILRFITLRHPSSTKPTSSFQITTYNGGIAIDTITDGVTYTASAGSLSSVSATADPSTAGSKSAFTVSFKISNRANSTSQLKIVFPTEFTTTPGTYACVGTGTNMNASSTCIMSSNTLTASYYATADLLASSTVTIIIPEIQLPKTTKPTITPLQIFTTEATYTIDRDSSIYFNSTVAAITAGLAVDISSGAKVAEVSTYTLSFINKNPIPASGQIVIGLPPDGTVTVSDVLSVQSGTNFSINGVVMKTISAAVNTAVTPNTITFTNPSSTEIAAGASLQVIIPSLVNPPSTALTNSFSIKTMTSDNYAIDATTTGLNIDADKILPSDFQFADFVPNPDTTGQVSSYTFTVIPKAAHTSSSTLSITFPSDITFKTPATVMCTVSSPVAATAVSCTPSSNVISLTLNQAVAALQAFVVTVSAVTNPLLSKTYTGFTLNTKFGTAKVHQTASALSKLINPSVIVTATLDRDNTVPAQPSKYTFNLKPVNQYPNDAYIEVIVPSQLEISTATTFQCTNFVGMGSSSPSCTATAARTIKITPGFSSGETYPSPSSGTNIKFVLDSIKNQAGQFDSDPFIIYVKDSTGLVIDQNTTGLASLSPCATTCLTCSATDRYSCTSCDTSLYLYDIVNSKCVTSCVAHTFQSGTQCQACSSICGNCTGSGDNQCSSCNSTSSYPFYNGTSCLTTCPDKYYADASNRCQGCVAPCSTCYNVSTCKTCDSDNWFYDGECNTYCPDRYYKANDSRKCMPCKSNCEACDSSTVCTSCDSSYILYNNTCYTTCPDGSFSSGSTCQACESPCLTCATISTNCKSCLPGKYPKDGTCVSCSSSCLTCSGAYDSCSSCDSGLYLQGTKCVSGCSDGYYLDTGLQQCTKCRTGCLTCSSLSKCTVCDATSSTPYMYSGTCVSNCPSGTTLSNRECITSGDGGGGTVIVGEVDRLNPYDGLYREGLPFPFIIFALIFGVLSFVGKVITHQTLVVSNILGFVSIIEFSAWIALAVLLILSHPDDSISNYTGLPFVMIAIVASVIINIVFYFKVIRPIVKSETFVTWKNQKKINRVFAIIAQVFAIISFKSFRLIYSRFFDVEPMSASLPSMVDHLSTFHKYLGLNFFLGVLPAFIASVITIHKDSDFSQCLNISIEIIIISLLSVALTIYEALRALEEAKKISAEPDKTNLMIDDSMMNKLNSTERVEGLTRKGAEKAMRRDSNVVVEGIYDEADTNGLNASSSFINLNNSMTMEKRVDGKNDESFDATEAVPGKGDENTRIEAIEEIEKDDEDDEPALNMNTKTMNKLQEMMKDRGQELEPQKILIENKDGSIIVLKDPSPRKGRKKAADGKDEDSEQELELQDSFEKDPDAEKKANGELKVSNEGLLPKEGEELLSPIAANPLTPGASEGLPNSPDGGKGKKKEDGFEYASSESQVSADDLHNHFMDDTPSNYNVLNQRYDEEFVSQAVVVPKQTGIEIDSMKKSMSGSPPKPIIMQHNFMDKERVPQHMDLSRNMTREYPPPRSNSSAEKQTPQSRTGYGKPMLGEKSRIMAENGMRLVTPQYTGEQKRVPNTMKAQGNRSGTPTASSYKPSGSVERKKTDSAVKDSRRGTGRSSDKSGDKASTDRISELETMYIKKRDMGSVKSSLSKISKKQVNQQRSGDDDLSDNDELELDNFGKFEEFVNGMRRPSVQKFDADSFDREVV